MRCLTAMRRGTLSPSLVNGFEFKDEKAKEKAGIKESAIKDYLVAREIPVEAIAYLAAAPEGKKAPPYLKGGDDSNDQKEVITKAFNDPKSKLKIIIGGDTIKEGGKLEREYHQYRSGYVALEPQRCSSAHRAVVAARE